MIVKSILFTMLLLAGYAGFLRLHNSKRQAAQHQWQENVIKAQNYIYNEKRSQLKIIVGSSLSNRLVMDSLPSDFYNLAFNGGSLFDGMDIILKSKTKPAKVFIEMNILRRDENTDFTNSLFMPVMYKLKEKIPLLLDKNQPVSFIGSWLSPRVGKFFIDPFTVKFWNRILDKLRVSNQGETNTGDSFVRELIENQVRNFSVPFDNNFITKKFTTLKEDVTQLTRTGVKVTFFEMPMDPALENSVQMKSARYFFKTYFPATIFEYIHEPVYSAYETTDGVHLNEESALKFTKYFIKNVN